MGTKRDISMSLGLTGEDEEFVRASELETFHGMRSLLEVYYIGSGTLDPWTQELIPASPTWMPVSGILSMIGEEDALLGMGGQVSMGDWKASFYWPDIEPYFATVEKIRNAEDGTVFSIEARLSTGLGPTKNRADFALKLKANE